MTLQSLFCTAAFTACLATPASATVIQGNLPDSPVGGYVGVMTDIHVLSGTEPSPTSAFVFCIEGSLNWVGGNSAHQYTLADSFAPFLAHPAAVGKATALLHYVVDSYLAPVLHGDYGDAGYDFNLVVWELTGDFDGTLDSLGTAVGYSNSIPTNSGRTFPLYEAILDDVRNNFAAISPSYRSARYDLRYLKETNSTYQSVAMVTEHAASNEVPEPSTLALVMAAGFGWTARRTRRQAKA